MQTVRQGDALQLYREVDEPHVIITDPVWPICPEGLLHGADGGDGPRRLWDDFLNLVYQKRRHVIRLVVILGVSCDPRFLTQVPSALEYLQTVWMEFILPQRRGRVLSSAEIAYVFGRPVKSAPGKRVISSYVTDRAQPHKAVTSHPAERNPLHCRFLVDRFSDPDELIVDPFAGGGTIGVAAVRYQRRYLGFEIDETWAREAQERIDHEAKQGFLPLQQTL